MTVVIRSTARSWLIMLDAKIALAKVLDNFNIAGMRAVSAAADGPFMWHI